MSCMSLSLLFQITAFFVKDLEESEVLLSGICAALVQPDLSRSYCYMEERSMKKVTR